MFFRKTVGGTMGKLIWCQILIAEVLFCCELVNSPCIALAGSNFFSMILNANQILSSFLRNIPSAKLIGTNPGNDCLSAVKVHLLNMEWNIMPVTDFVSVMTVNNNPVPGDDGLTTAIHHKVAFQLQILILP